MAYLDEQQAKLENTMQTRCWNEDRFIRGFMEDGTVIGRQTDPETTDWENMVLDWTQVFGALPEGIEGPVYLGCRGCWKEEQQEAWNASRQLWENLCGQRIHTMN